MTNPSIAKQIVHVPPELKNGTSDMIYHTVFKKGNIINDLYFKHEGDLESAVSKVKDYLQRHCLRHIHTVPFLVNLDEAPRAGNLEEIDIG